MYGYFNGRVNNTKRLKNGHMIIQLMIRVKEKWMSQNALWKLKNDFHSTKQRTLPQAILNKY